jgi:hypothetical protein
MAKISNLIAYPTVAPQLGDYVIGTDTSNSNETVNFTLQSIANIIPADTLAEVLAAGNTATNDINLTGNITLIGNLSTSGTIADSSGDVGTSGQVLSSTGTGTNWISTIAGSGTLNRIAMFTPDGLTIGDSKLSQSLPLSSGLYQMRFDDCDRFIINKPSSVTTGDPEYLIQQDGDFKVSFGWDDDGAGFGYIYNWAGNGLRLGAAGQNPQFELNTTVPKIISHTNHEFEAEIIDRLGNVGSSGQVLSSAASGVQWIDQLPSGLNFQGEWDANANNPALASGVGVQGYYYIVGTPGTTNLDGNNSWQTGDWAIFNGTVWQEIDNQNIFSGSGTINTLTKWTGTQSLGNSSITDDGTSVIVANDTYLQGSTIQIGNAPTDSTVVNAVSTFQANARFNSTMQDAGGQPGTSGQVLSSTGTSVLWKSVVDGSGTANKIPKWLDSDTLTDSAISDVAGAVSITGSSFTSTSSANVEITSTTGPITLSAFGDVNIDSQTTTHINRNNLTSDIGLWGPAVFENSAYFKSTIKDSTNAVGTAGQVLSSTGTATQWINNSSALPLADGTRVVQGTVTSAQILNMFTSPVVLISDPGGSKIIVVDSVVVKYNFVTSDYSNLGFPSIKYRVVSSGILGSSVTNTLPMSGSQDNWTVFTDTNTSTQPGSEIVVSTAPQNPTGGDSTLFYNIKYRILNSADLTVDLT